MTERRRREGTEELFLSGIPTEIASEFRSLSRGAGKYGKDLTLGEVFLDIWNEWKSNRGRKILDVAGLPTEKELEAWLRSHKLSREDIEEILPLLRKASQG